MISRCGTGDVPTNNWLHSPVTGNNSWHREDDVAAASWVNPNSRLYAPVSSQGTDSAHLHSGQAVRTHALSSGQAKQAFPTCGVAAGI